MECGSKHFIPDTVYNLVIFSSRRYYSQELHSSNFLLHFWRLLYAILSTFQYSIEASKYNQTHVACSRNSSNICLRIHDFQNTIYTTEKEIFTIFVIKWV